jgi:hypothetical protein
VKRPSSSSPRRRGGSNPKRTWGIVLLAVTTAFILIASACSNQGEGERCELLNGNDDCKTDEGLICFPSAQLRNTTSDRCCPADRARATHPVCKTSVDPGGGDALAPGDTGTPFTPDTGAPDVEAGTEDAGSDAGDNDADAADQ